MKTLGRIILILLMIRTVIQLISYVMAIVAAANHKPEMISGLMGSLVATLLFLILLIWLFRKLGNKNSDDH